MNTRKIRAYHGASGSILVADVTEEIGTAPRRSFRITAEGLLEELIIREGVWHITELEQATVTGTRP